MRLIAHRGYSHRYGDNNMISFREAFNNGFDMIELDIQLCASEEVVIYHDTYIDNKYIRNINYQDLKKHNILLLEEFFKEFHNKNILIYLDIKGKQDVSLPLIKLIKKWYSNKYEYIYVSGFNRKFINEFVSSGLPVHLGFTTENNFHNEHLEILTKHCSFACLHWTVLDDNTIQFLQSKNIEVFSYTCKERFIQEHMKKFKLDGIVSNYPI
tara:strand:- start:171 stop:806 length:636 start_codon:yes stop_codon:yes gene_type:complete